AGDRLRLDSSRFEQAEDRLYAFNLAPCSYAGHIGNVVRCLRPEDDGPGDFVRPGSRAVTDSLLRVEPCLQTKLLDLFVIEPFKVDLSQEGFLTGYHGDCIFGAPLFAVGAAATAGYVNHGQLVLYFHRQDRTDSLAGLAPLTLFRVDYRH